MVALNGEDLEQRVQNLEKGMEVQAAAQAGAQATQAAAQVGLASAVIAGSAGLVVGMLLGALFARA